jgi:hypothetical protein
MGMQPRTALETQYAAARRRQERWAAEGDQMLCDGAKGVVAALGWVLGERPAPMTGTAASAAGVTTTDVGREEDLALDVLYRRRAAEPGMTWSYVSGVEHALLWARDGTDQPPATVCRGSAA